MVRVEQFFKTVLAALNPRSYDRLSGKRYAESIRYFFALFFLTFLVMCLLGIPNLLQLPSYLREQLTSFDTLDIDVKQEMNRAFFIPEERPILMIDTSDLENERKAKVLVTEDTITYKFLPFTEPRTVDLGEGDLLERNKETSKLLAAMVLLMLPGILLLFIIALLVKYLVIIVLSAVIGFLLAGFIRFRIKFRQLFNVAIYASTLMIVIELLTAPFLRSSFFIHYVVYGVYFVLGMIRAGDFEDRGRKE